MKTRFTEYLLLSMLSWVLLLFGGCKGEPSCPDEGTSYYFVSDSRKALIPYSGNDSIRFTNKNKLTSLFISNEIKHTFGEIRKRDPNPDCNVYQTTKFEVLQYVFYNEAKTDSLFLQLESMTGYCAFIGNNAIFYFTNYAFKSLDTHIDSIYLDDKWYYNHTTLINPQLDTLVVNKEHGILKCVNYSTGQQLTLKQ